MKIPSCSEEIFREENLILYQLRYCYFTPIPVTIGCKENSGQFLFVITLQ